MKLRISIFVIMISTLLSCSKEKDVIYDVNAVNVDDNSIDKSRAKTTSEFISIAYADLFGTTISQGDLLKLNTVYTAFGDKKLIEDRIIKNFLNNSNVNVPVAYDVDTSAFVNAAYKKFYNRSANAFELYYVKEQIRLNANLQPIVLYYGLMTSDEYRYY